MAAMQISDGRPDGATIGASASEKISFYGVTTVIQPTSTAAVTTTGATSTTNAYGFTTAAQADAIVSQLNDVIAKLTTIGILSAT